MTHTPYRQIGTPTRGGIVAVCDHASNHVPEGVELGVTAEVLDKHVGWDIGTAGVVERLVRRHGMAAHLATLSRLVIDLHREEDSKASSPKSATASSSPAISAPTAKGGSRPTIAPITPRWRAGSTRPIRR